MIALVEFFNIGLQPNTSPIAGRQGPAPTGYVNAVQPQKPIPLISARQNQVRQEPVRIFGRPINTTSLAAVAHNKIPPPQK